VVSAIYLYYAKSIADEFGPVPSGPGLINTRTWWGSFSSESQARLSTGSLE
jgi:hypothetical protein